MTFLAPLLLLGLLLVPVLVALYAWAQRRRTRYAVRFTNLDLLANIAPTRPAWRRHVPPVLYLGAVAALVLGLARPSMVVATPREDATVMLAIDVSGSMKATDVAPTRLDAAREAASSFIDQLPEGIRVGIVTFASRPVTLVAPTTDREQLDTALDGLVAQDGTAMGDALMMVLDTAERIQAETPAATPAPDATASPDASALPGASDAPVDQPADEPLVAAILLSDGANSVGETEPLDAAERAATLGVPVYTIALGTEDGQVQVRDPQSGQVETLDVPPDTETLAQIAEITGAAAFDAPTASDLSAVYDNLQSRVGFTEEEQEVTSWFAAGALILVVAAAGLSALWFGRLP
ncbi:MAG TPA: VWA domain-containing protein [Candidatus Saccharimonadales bacterium]|nr:VWA domain-containing protein [Candidatus Saccharimonadales bacterium]